jgi:hypothetical protein
MTPTFKSEELEATGTSVSVASDSKVEVDVADAEVAAIAPVT